MKFSLFRLLLLLGEPIHGGRVVLQGKEALELGVVFEGAPRWLLVLQGRLTVKKVDELTFFLKKHQLLLVFLSAIF